jgi:hypothetical protein
MSIPQHPETIVIKNQLYPKGIKEIDIWNYYQKVKSKILTETMNKDLMFGIMVEENKSVFKRNYGDSIIRLTPKNYDTLITGRTVSIYSEMGAYEEYAIIDIDIDPSDGFRWAKMTTSNVYEYVVDKMPIVRKATIRFTGKTSFHVVCEFGKKMKIDTIRYLMRKFLHDSPLSKAYTIEMKRRPGVPNLDLSPNKIRGSYITLHSLSLIGLKCMEVEYSKLAGFQPRMALL